MPEIILGHTVNEIQVKAVWYYSGAMNYASAMAEALNICEEMQVSPCHIAIENDELGHNVTIYYQVYP